jgi:hypothetical protein
MKVLTVTILINRLISPIEHKNEFNSFIIKMRLMRKNSLNWIEKSSEFVTLDLTSEREEIKGKGGFKDKDDTIEKIE